jgi:putative MATE family efflux protein
MAEKTGGQVGADFTQGDITQHLLHFMLPLLLAGILNNLYNMVDTVIISQFVGPVGNVAVSTGGKVMMTLSMLGTGLSGAGQTVIGQLVGKGERMKVEQAVGSMFTLLAVMSVVLGLASFLIAEPMIQWLNTPKESYEGAVAYMRITSLGLILTSGYYASCAVLRGMGDSTHPLIFIAIAAVVNLVLDLVFIIALDWGAAGTAWATIIGQGVSFLISLCYLYHQRDSIGFDFRLKSFRLDWNMTGTILRIGIPMTMASLFISATQVVVMGFVNTYGVVQAAAYGVADKLLTLENVANQSISQAGSTIVAQNIGAGKTDRVKQLVHASLKVSLTIALIVGLFGVLFPEAIFRIFLQDEEVLAYAKPFMLVAAGTCLISACHVSVGAVVNGTGNARLQLITGFLDGVVLRIALGIFFGQWMGLETVGFFMGHGLARLAPLTGGLIYYLSGRWKTRQLFKVKE